MPDSRFSLSAIKERILPHYQRANHRSRGILEIIRVTIKNFTAARSMEAAASMSYYALFSLFPLLLILVSVAGLIIRQENAYVPVLNFFYEVVPISQSIIERNLDIILKRSATTGVIGLVGAFWSASGFFNTLVRNINLAWRGVRPVNVIRTRLLALIMIIVIVILLVLSISSTVFVNLLDFIKQIFPFQIHLEDTLAWPYISLLLPYLFTYLMFISLYRWVPHTAARWRACLWGALVTSILWELVKLGFGYYVSSGMANFELVYGSLGTVLGLMLYIYLSCNTVLLGAHLTATIDQRPQPPKKLRVKVTTKKIQ